MCLFSVLISIRTETQQRFHGKHTPDCVRTCSSHYFRITHPLYLPYDHNRGLPSVDLTILSPSCPFLSSILSGPCATNGVPVSALPLLSGHVPPGLTHSLTPFHFYLIISEPCRLVVTCCSLHALVFSIHLDSNLTQRRCYGKYTPVCV